MLSTKSIARWRRLLSRRARRKHEIDLLMAARWEFRDAKREWASTSRVTNRILQDWPTETYEEKIQYTKAREKLTGKAGKRFKRAFDRLWRLGYFWYLTTDRLRSTEYANMKEIVWQTTLSAVIFLRVSECLGELNDNYREMAAGLRKIGEDFRASTKAIR